MRNLIFSNRLFYRVARHVLFWTSRIIFITSYNCLDNYRFDINFFQNLLISLQYIVILALLSDIAFCYPVIYYFVPKFFLKKKYVAFSVSVIATAILVFAIVNYYNYQHYGMSQDMLFRLIWNSTISFLFIGPVTVCGLFLAIKILKTWYLKEEEKRLLMAANANTEIQLLKAQVHPHFLFNTLNNIYSYVLNEQPQAAELVLKLADAMSYMVSECDAEFVQLTKEIKLITDYIGLEKVRYGNRLDMQIEITGEITGKEITPLLMIPFIENSFKHGASKMLRNPWVKLFIQIDEDILHFTITNSKPFIEIANERKGGIGLANVKKRLKLLYPQNHLLLIEETENTFTVNMQVPIFASSTEPIKQPMYAA